MTDTYGLLGTRTDIPIASSNDFFISLFKKGDSENPPTIKIKFTGDSLVVAAC